MKSLLYRPDTALVSYRSVDLARNGEVLMLELFKISEGRLHSPRSLKAADLDALAQAVGREQGSDRLGGLLPEEVFYLRKNTLGFLTPPGLRRIALADYRSRPRERLVESILIWVPSMVFFYEGPGHHVRAYWCKGGRKALLAEEKCLLPALLPNCYDDGSVCLGDSMQRVAFSPDPQTMMEATTQAFWNSLFTEVRRTEALVMMEQLAAIAMEPDLTAAEARYIEPHFWAHPSEALLTHIKKSPWQSLQAILARS